MRKRSVLMLAACFTSLVILSGCAVYPSGSTITYEYRPQPYIPPNTYWVQPPAVMYYYRPYYWSNRGYYRDGRWYRRY